MAGVMAGTRPARIHFPFYTTPHCSLRFFCVLCVSVAIAPLSPRHFERTANPLQAVGGRRLRATTSKRTGRRARPRFLASRRRAHDAPLLPDVDCFRPVGESRSGRAPSRFANGAESIDVWKQRRIVRATQHLLARNRGLARLPVRFDVVALQPPPANSLQWIRGAFEVAG